MKAAHPLLSSSLDRAVGDLFGDLLSPMDPEEVFELTETLGRGAHGTVYKAINRTSGQMVAIKHLMDVQREHLPQILREIEVMKDLNSPYCVGFIDAYYKHGNIWIIMDFFDSGSIGDQLMARKRLPESEICYILYRVLHALVYIHERGLIHRDIKAGNIMLSTGGAVALADFGIVGCLEGSASKQSQIGSPFWMAPEMIKGDPYDQKADIWSLGITVLEMSDFNHPLFEQNPMTHLFRIVAEDESPTLQGDGWSTALQNFVSSCLTKKPEERPSAMDLLQSRLFRGLSIVSSSTTEDTTEDVDEDEAQGTQLAEQYHSLIRAVGSNATLRGEKLGQNRREVVRFFLADGSFRGLLVRKEECVSDVTARLKEKVGLSDTSTKEYGIYRRYKENERKLDAEDTVLRHMEANPDVTLVFKESPDVNAFEKLMAINAVLEQCGGADRHLLSYNHTAVDPFVDLLLSPGFSVMRAFCRTQKFHDTPGMCDAIVLVYRHFDELPQLLCALCEEEVLRTVAVSRMFLQVGSIAGRLMGSYGKTGCRSFLCKLLRSTFDRVSQLKQSLNIDSQRVGEDHAEHSCNVLKDMVEDVLARILDHTDELPPLLKEICLRLRSIIIRSFPPIVASGNHVVVPHLVFVRLICPALVNPQLFGLVKYLPSHAHHTLVLFSKLLKNVILGTPWREEHSEELNRFIHGKSHVVLKLCLAILDEDGGDIVTIGGRPASTSEIRALQRTLPEMGKAKHASSSLWSTKKEILNKLDVHLDDPAIESDPEPAIMGVEEEGGGGEWSGDDPVHWGVKEVSCWLDAISFPQYRSAFEENGVTGKMLMMANGPTLKKWGVGALGHRKNIQRAVRDVARSSSLASSSIPPAETTSHPNSPIITRASETLKDSLTFGSSSYPRVETTRVEKEHSGDDEATNDLEESKRSTGSYVCSTGLEMAIAKIMNAIDTPEMYLQLGQLMGVLPSIPQSSSD